MNDQPIKVAVLGAGGFLGARVVEMLKADPRVEIRPILRTFRSMARLSKLQIKVQRVDTTDVVALAAALKGCRVVLNATTGDWVSALPDVRKFLTASRDAGVERFIHLSTAAVFGSVDRADIGDDSVAPRRQWFLYAAEKARAEHFLRDHMALPDGPAIVVLRPGLIWGPRSGWVTRPAGELRAGRAVLAGRGAGVCNLCHVDNLVRYIMAVVLAASPVSGFYNVADEETIPWGKYYADIAAGLGLAADCVLLNGQAGPGLSPALVMEWVKSQPLGYRAMRWVINNLTPKSKSLLKWYLPALGGGGATPPTRSRPSEALAYRARFTRETWTLHHTRRKLPSDKFWRDYGKPQLISYREAMIGVTAWLRAGGFADL